VPNVHIILHFLHFHWCSFVSAMSSSSSDIWLKVKRERLKEVIRYQQVGLVGKTGSNFGMPAANPYNYGRNECPIDMIADWDSERVTIWKTILSLFLMCGANGFEGVQDAGVGLGMVGDAVCRVNRK
jgi:hypothetical protein